MGWIENLKFVVNRVDLIRHFKSSNRHPNTEWMFNPTERQVALKNWELDAESNIQSGGVRESLNDLYQG
jgi:hypothetical protein